MKTIQAIVDLARGLPPGEKLALATVMKVRGSAYRRPGARMLLTSAGVKAGMISGGCLDEDVREHGRAVMASGVPRLLTYDSTSPAEIIIGLGLGCGGVVQVLLEPLPVGERTGLLDFFAACADRRQTGRIATVFGPGANPLVARLLRWPDGTATSQQPEFSGALAHLIQAAGTRRTALREIELPDVGRAEVLVETIAPAVPFFLFGAADDAIPVAQLAKSLGWRVTVVDPRPAYARAERFPMADEVLCVRPEAVLENPDVVLPPESVAMIMTHLFNHDRELLRVLLPRPLRYVGLLGPKSRTERLLAELATEGVTFDAASLGRLYGPAGLDLGAETPEEIAVSILAEMQAVLAARPGGPLRDCGGPIHDPVDQPAPPAQPEPFI